MALQWFEKLLSPLLKAGPIREINWRSLDAPPCDELHVRIQIDGQANSSGYVKNGQWYLVELDGFAGYWPEPIDPPSGWAEIRN